MADMIFENSITLVEVSDGAQGQPGADANAYYISTNYDEILKFKTQNGWKFSPNVLEISVYKKYEEQAIELADNYQLGHLNKSSGKFENVDLKYLSHKTTVDEEDNIQENKLLVMFDIEQFFVDKSIQFGETIKEQDHFFKITYILNNKEEAIKVISLRNGASDELAQFNITATSINAAVRNSCMQFSDIGLELGIKEGISDAGLKIYKLIETLDEDSNPIIVKSNAFWADQNGDLHLKGIINAEGGSFTGTIKALEGSIGGLNISSSVLSSSGYGYAITKDDTPQSDKKYYIKSDNVYVEQSGLEEFSNNQTYYETMSKIILDGTDGSMYAKKITIGSEAEVESYIRLGNAYLCNPEAHDNEFLRVVDSEGEKVISFKDNGEISLLGDSVIQGNNWSITPDRASFQNVSVSGTIDTAVFNTSSVQAVGSAMLFMPSYKVESVGSDKQTIVLETKISISEGTKVWLVRGNTYKLYQIVNTVENQKEITLNSSLEETFEPVAMIVIGEDGDLVFGVNSGNAKTADDFIFQRGLTINTYGNSNGLPNLFLGDLSSLGTSYTGYGLYSDNVYLNGSLTTEVGENSYAGVNTLSGARANKFDGDGSKIVFWAGAESTSNGAIQNAPFQVTEQGSIYASRANLTSSLFVGGEIKGADIYAARIHGWENTEAAALTIYDTAKGISFKTGYSSGNEKETFSIGSDGLSTNQKTFVGIDNGTVSMIANNFKLDNTGNKLEIGYDDNVPVIKHTQGQSKCGFYFGENKTSFEINGMEKFIVENTSVMLRDNIIFQNSQNDKMTYSSVDGGYDLFVE